MRLLELFSGDSKSDWSVDEAAIELGLSASHTYRYFRTLSGAGYISAFTRGATCWAQQSSRWIEKCGWVIR